MAQQRSGVLIALEVLLVLCLAGITAAASTTPPPAAVGDRRALLQRGGFGGGAGGLFGVDSPLSVPRRSYSDALAASGGGAPPAQTSSGALPRRPSSVRRPIAPVSQLAAPGGDEVVIGAVPVTELDASALASGGGSGGRRRMLW